MSIFCYHGIFLSTNDSIPYNRAIVKANDVYDAISSEAAVQKLHDKPYTIILNKKVHAQFHIIAEISNSNWIFGIFDRDTFTFITMPNILYEFTPNNMFDFSRKFQQIAFAMLNGQIENNYYTNLPDSVLSKWEEYKSFVAQKENVNTVYDAKFTDIKTDYDLKAAVERANSVKKRKDEER